ncbi:MAG: sensor histidine kinase [Dongiaceae bacterium]
MNVLSKLLLSQSLNVLLIVAVALVAVVVAQRFDHQLKRAELAYDQRQTITMLAVQAFHYKTAIGDALYDGRNKPGELDLARQDVQATLRQLGRQTEQELAFLASEEQTEGAEEGERLGQLEGGFAGIDALVDRMVQLRQAGSNDSVRQLHELIEQRFEGEIAELLAAAMADEEREADETDARIAELAARRVAFLIAAGLCALAISVVTGLALGRSISRPMRQLLAGVGALKMGDLRHRVECVGGDEFAQLASQFNEMAGNLEDRERRLLAARSDLEQQVAQRTADLETANQRLRYLDQRRLQFLAEVSHELRTPVTILRGEAEVTLRVNPESPAPYRESLARIAQQAAQMGRLIDDLLFLVRSEGDTVTFEKQRVDLQDIVADAVRDGAVLAQGKRIAITENLPGEPVWASADAQRLRQAVLIAIDNAVKYSDADSIVEVALTAADGRAAITVRDHGVGVPAEELPYVFERFYRIRGTARRPTEGSGLGLPIAKWIAEKHDGSIAMSSRPGETTELVIELPRLEAKEP